MEVDLDLRTVFIYDPSQEIKYSFRNIPFEKILRTSEGVISVENTRNDVMIYKLQEGELVIVSANVEDEDLTSSQSELH